MKANRRLLRSLSLVMVMALLLGLIGLSPASAQEEGLFVALSGGNNQSACIGMAYALPLQVTVTDSGLPVADAVVEFSAPSSHASVVPDAFTATTGADGVASATVTANGTVGSMDIYASYGGQTVVFQLTNTPELVVEISGGDEQSAVVETAYAFPLQVTVTHLGVPVAGAVVDFESPKHPGVAGLLVDQFSATTDANGVASAAVTANEYPGAMEVSAGYDKQAAVFHLTNLVEPLVVNSNPYFLESRCEFVDNAFAHDNSANGNRHVCDTKTNAADCAQYNFCWWRDTTNQNAIAQQSSSQFTGQVSQPFTSSKLKVLFYSTNSAANVVALISTSSFFLIGSGGGKNEANAAKMAIQAFYPAIGTKTLKGIIYTSADPQVTWGSQFWLSAFRTNPPAPVYASSLTFDALERRWGGSDEQAARDGYVFGKNLTWGQDSFLGLGSGKAYLPTLSFYAPPTIFIGEEITLYLDSVPVTLIPTLPELAGLTVWLPNQDILLADFFGRYLPNVAPLNAPYIPLEQATAALDLCLGYHPMLFLPMHTLYISGEQAIVSALTVEKDALNSIHDQTLTYLNQHHHVDDGDIECDWHSTCTGCLCDTDGDGVPDDHATVADYGPDDIVNLVQLPGNLASSPYAQPLAGTVASIVHALYHEHVGWFDGNPANLWTLPSQEYARRMVELAGGVPAALQYARQCLTEHTREGAQMALEVAGYLRQISPSDDANDIYINALKMLGFTAQSAFDRNWYLQEAYQVQMEQ